MSYSISSEVTFSSDSDAALELFDFISAKIDFTVNSLDMP
jgi:hypothetical protein